MESIHEEMLAAIDDKYQKTPGFPAWDFTRAFALACMSLSEDIAVAEAHLNVENLSGIDLDTFITQHRGLSRRDATHAEATLRIVTGADTIEIEIGDLFSTESGVQFEAVLDGTYTVGDSFQVQAVEGGESGNVAAGTITYMPVTIAGLGSVVNDAPASGGYAEETDDEYRERYYADLKYPSNGSNQQAYRNWATSVAGVGFAKIFPQALGDNTVEVCILNADMEPAAAGLIADVQALIDPNGNGDGAGTAPIGAVCTVTTGTSLAVNVSATLILASGVSLASVKAEIEEGITDYLRSIAFQQSYVSYAQIGKVIGTAEGVLDYSGLLVNGAVANLDVGDRQTPVLGTVTLTTS